MIALIRYEVSATLRAHGRVCAVELLAGDVTPATWRLLAAECESLSAHRSGTYVRRAVAETCERMARGGFAPAHQLTLAFHHDLNRLAHHLEVIRGRRFLLHRQHNTASIAPHASACVTNQSGSRGCTTINRSRSRPSRAAAGG